DNLLREAVVKFNGKAWKRIAEYCFPNGSRNKDQCLQRWRMISKPRSIKGPWTPEEDRQLRALVNELGAEKWVLIASRLGSRTGKQCRERWHNHLDPTIDKSPFTPKENELIFKLFEQFGSKWAEMSKLMPGRPDNAIKNHFNTSMQRKRRRLSLQDPAERRHSMPSLDVSPKQLGPVHGAHRRNGSRDYTVDSTHPLQHMQPNGPGPGICPRTIPTPPKTPDTKFSLKLASNMSRSISLGSSDRHNTGMPGTGTPQNGPVRPNLPGIASLHKPQQQPPMGNGSGHFPFVASTTAAMVPPSSSTTSLASSTPPSIRMARSTSSMESFSSHGQHPTLNHALPRPNMSRHESSGSSGRFVRGHEHHRSLDIDQFSALAELANLAEQHGGSRANNAPTTVVVQSKDEADANLLRRSSYGGESMSRSGSGGSGHDLGDVEDAVVKTMIERPPPSVLGRRFSTLGHVKEEEHGEDGEDGQARHHSYHIEARKKARSPLGHSRSYSGHDYSSFSRELMTTTDYRPKRFSVDFTATRSEPTSEHDDDENMRMDEDVRSHRNNPSLDKGVSPPSSNTPGPSAAYLEMRRGSVRELMAIDNLCLSSEEVERC
ncbi:Transcription factor myb3r-5, partial [Mortierella sp. GBA43]